MCYDLYSGLKESRWCINIYVVYCKITELIYRVYHQNFAKLFQFIFFVYINFSRYAVIVSRCQKSILTRGIKFSPHNGIETLYQIFI